MAYTFDTRRSDKPAAPSPQAKAAQPAARSTPVPIPARLRPLCAPWICPGPSRPRWRPPSAPTCYTYIYSVADAGAEAVAQGSRIAFAPGKLDFASASGQALLGHELSHVVSQAREEVSGSGFLNDAALEARADREGAMAAAGEQVYAGPVTAALSSAAPAAGPMQASKAVNKGKKHYDRIQKYKGMLNTPGLTPTQIKRYQKKQDSARWWMNYWMSPPSPRRPLQRAKSTMMKW